MGQPVIALSDFRLHIHLFQAFHSQPFEFRLQQPAAMVFVLLSLGLVELSLLGNIVPDLVLASTGEAKALLVFEAAESEQVYYL